MDQGNPRRRSTSTAPSTAQLALVPPVEQPTPESEKPAKPGAEDTNTATSDEVIEIRREELMRLATQLRTSAAMIDALVKRRKRADLDDNGEPTFAFGAKVPLPKDFHLTHRLAKYAQDKGFNGASTKNMLAEFVRYYAKTGKKWQDWSRVWMDWVSREVKRQGGATLREFR
jgi:hypothetical protein